MTERTQPTGGEGLADVIREAKAREFHEREMLREALEVLDATAERGEAFGSRDSRKVATQARRAAAAIREVLAG